MKRNRIRMNERRVNGRKFLQIWYYKSSELTEWFIKIDIEWVSIVLANVRSYYEFYENEMMKDSEWNKFIHNTHSLFHIHSYTKSAHLISHLWNNRYSFRTKFPNNVKANAKELLNENEHERRIWIRKSFHRAILNRSKNVYDGITYSYILTDGGRERGRKKEIHTHTL